MREDTHGSPPRDTVRISEARLRNLMRARHGPLAPAKPMLAFLDTSIQIDLLREN